MFYSPKKDIQRYVTLKNHQIKTLKHELQTQKVTEENVQLARKKLQKLKNQYNHLISENHHQLIDTLRNAEDNKKCLQAQILLKEKEHRLKSSQKSDVTDMRKQIMDKIKKTQQKMINQKQKLASKLNHRQELDSQISKKLQSNKKMRDQNSQTQTLVKMGEKQLTQCQTKILKHEQKCQSLKNLMNTVGSKVLNQKQNLGCMNAQTKIQELKMQNYEMKLCYLMQIKQNLLQKKQKLVSQKLVSKQRSELNKHQTVSAQIVQVLVRLSNEMKQRKQVQGQACERQIKERLIELELTQCVNTQLDQQVKMVRQKICKTQANSLQIQHKIGEISSNEWDLVSVRMRQSMQLACVSSTKKQKLQRKASQNCSPSNKENVQSQKMSFKQSMWSKLNLLQLANTCQDQYQIGTQ